MNRLYAIESMPTITGSRADHRLALKPSDIERAARRLAASVGASAAAGAGSEVSPTTAKWIDAIAKDLKARRGAGLVGFVPRARHRGSAPR